MQKTLCIFAALLAFSLPCLSFAAQLTGDEARALAIAVAAFSLDASWKHYHHYSVTVRHSGRNVLIEFTPNHANIWTTQGRKYDTLHIQTFGRSAKYVIDPSSGRIVSSSFERD